MLGMVSLVLSLVACEPEQIEVPRELTQSEIDALCQPKVEEQTDALTEAQTKVATLERTAAEQEGKVREMEEKMARNAEAGKAQREELARLKAELAETKEKLAQAEAEKQVLLTDLRQTKEELATRTEERDVAREDALANRWQAFMNDSQLEICEKGNRKKMGNCREAVAASLGTDARRDRFAHCIRSAQAQPTVRELDNGQQLPEFSEMMDEEVKQVKGWYIAFCDPTLPERSDAPLSEGHLPSKNPAAADADG